LLPPTHFINPHQTTTITGNNANQTIIFSLSIPEGTIGFINEVANNWFPNTIIYWYVDGELYKKIDYQMAEINNPKQVNPPILVKSIIEFKAVNNDSSAHAFEVLCDGLIYLDKGD
jgi:hypothetical protein